MDHFKLVLVWPEAQNRCTVQRAGLGHEKFTIHGLWAQDANRDGVNNCTSVETFDIAKLKDLEDDLKKNWPGIGEPNESFWRRQWNKHGTCSGMTLKNYFKAALDAHTRIGDLRKFLEIRGVEPNDSLSPSEMIGGAIHQGSRFVPQIYCTKDPIDGTDMLHQVSFEMDAQLNFRHSPKFRNLYHCHDCKDRWHIRFAKIT